MQTTVAAIFFKLISGLAKKYISFDNQSDNIVEHYWNRSASL